MHVPFSDNLCRKKGSWRNFEWNMNEHDSHQINLSVISLPAETSTFNLQTHSIWACSPPNMLTFLQPLCRIREKLSFKGHFKPLICSPPKQTLASAVCKIPSSARCKNWTWLLTEANTALERSMKSKLKKATLCMKLNKRNNSKTQFLQNKPYFSETNVFTY